MDYSNIQKPDLGYCYEFTLDELDAAQQCVEAHGFAIVKNVLPDEQVEELQQSVKQVLDPDGTLGEGNSIHTSPPSSNIHPPCGRCSTLSISCRRNGSSARPRS